MMSLYSHTLYHLSKLKFTEEVLPEELPELLFICFPFTLLPHGGLFYRLCPSNYPINKSCMG
jgi:hypothetical protein